MNNIINWIRNNKLIVIIIIILLYLLISNNSKNIDSFEETKKEEITLKSVVLEEIIGGKKPVKLITTMSNDKKTYYLVTIPQSECYRDLTPCVGHMMVLMTEEQYKEIESQHKKLVEKENVLCNYNISINNQKNNNGNKDIEKKIEISDDKITIPKYSQCNKPSFNNGEFNIIKTTNNKYKIITYPEGHINPLNQAKTLNYRKLDTGYSSCSDIASDVNYNNEAELLEITNSGTNKKKYKIGFKILTQQDKQIKEEYLYLAKEADIDCTRSPYIAIGLSNKGNILEFEIIE